MLCGCCCVIIDVVMVVVVVGCVNVEGFVKMVNWELLELFSCTAVS